MSTTWQTPISSFETNRRRVGALKSLGVVSVGDALTYYPFRVTEPVPADALSVGRARQKNIEGWAHKHFEALRAQK